MKRLFLSGLLATVLGLAGCATTLIYNHADWLLTRQLDGYFDLSRPQKTFVSGRLSLILDRHRHEALPRYEAVLQQVQERIQRGLTDDDLDWAFLQYDQLRTDLFSRFARDGADFIRLVEDKQVAHLRKALHQQLLKQEPLVRGTLEARVKQRTQRMLALAKEWLGSMTRQQEQALTEIAEAGPDTVPTMYAYQQQRHEQLLAVFEARHREEGSAKLHAWLVDQKRGADPGYLEAARQQNQHLGRVILALDQLATPQQRQHVLAKLDDLEQTIRRLNRA